MSTLSEKTAAFLRKTCHEQRLSPRQLSRRSGVSPTTLANILSGKTKSPRAIPHNKGAVPTREIFVSYKEP